MAASLLENGGVPNATTPETRINAKNQGESETDKVLFFNRPQGILRIGRLKYFGASVWQTAAS
jgi:hypothetical protein